jgi:hypothetical protein
MKPGSQAKTIGVSGTKLSIGKTSTQSTLSFGGGNPGSSNKNGAASLGIKKPESAGNVIEEKTDADVQMKTTLQAPAGPAVD